MFRHRNEREAKSSGNKQSQRARAPAHPSQLMAYTLTLHPCGSGASVCPKLQAVVVWVWL